MQTISPSPERPIIRETVHRRSAQQFEQAKRHSHLVQWLKRLLPAAALCVVVLFAGISALSFNPFRALDIAGIGLEDGKLVMREPKLEGVDRNDRPFTVQANSALQDLEQPDMIELNSIAAQMEDEGGAATQVSARNGLYNSKSEQLVLTNGVSVKGANGLDIQLDNADIDMRTGEMTSQDPVTVTSRDSRVTADSVHVKDNGNRIIFKERVRMVIDRPQSTQDAQNEDDPS